MKPTKYRLNSILQDPKPLVVGIGWVVECVEQRARVDEARFSVDLDGMNIAGANKVRVVRSHIDHWILNLCSFTASSIHVTQATVRRRYLRLY